MIGSWSHTLGTRHRASPQGYGVSRPVRQEAPDVEGPDDQSITSTTRRDRGSTITALSFTTAYR